MVGRRGGARRARGRRERAVLLRHGRASARCWSRRSGAGDVLVAVRRRLPRRPRRGDRPARAARRRGAVRADRHRRDRRGLRRGDARLGRDAVEPRARRLRHRGGRRTPRTPPGARLAVDNTLRHAARPAAARPRRRRRRCYSATKALSGHSDLVLGAVARARPGVGGGAARAPLAGRRDRRAVRGLAAAPLAADARAAARASERERARARALPARAAATCATSAIPGSRSTRSHALAARQMQLRGPARRLHARRRRARAALPRRARAGRRGDELRRRALDAPSGARAGGPTTSPRASSASRRAARTPTTCSPTSSRRSRTAEGPAAGQAPRVHSRAQGPGVRGTSCAVGCDIRVAAALRGLEGPFERRWAHPAATDVGETLASSLGESVASYPSMEGSGSGWVVRLCGPLARRASTTATRQRSCPAARAGCCSPTSASTAIARARAAS